MNTPAFQDFLEDRQKAVRFLLDQPLRTITIVHHNDTDGIAAGAILKTALSRAGYTTENIPIERVHPLFLPRIHTQTRKLILYADLGSQSLTQIGAAMREGSRVLVLDHHLPVFSRGDPLRNDLVLVNPELYGIDGDFQASAAAVAFFWSQALDGANDNLAHLAVVGAAGDHQLVRGDYAGLNRTAFDIACRQDTIRCPSDAAADAVFPLFGLEKAEAISRRILDLAVAGYHQGGALLAVDFCLRGPSTDTERFAARVRHVQAERFRQEIQRIEERGLESRGGIQWIDTADRLHPLSLKAIGILCQQLSAGTLVHPDRYLAGFQDFPREFPLLGTFEADEIKVSLRVPPGIRAAIEKGEKPHLAEIVPPAAGEAGGHAEGCHRYAAACTIPRKNRFAFLQALERHVNIWVGGIPGNTGDVSA
ncbi:MAG: DHH family phosphoesterase [Hyphomicrobiales bacterium]